MKGTNLRLIKPKPLEEMPKETGPELLETVVSLTGLPADAVTQELTQILEENGCSSQNLTLDELRDALLRYLEALHSEMGGDCPSDDATH